MIWNSPTPSQKPRMESLLRIAARRRLLWLVPLVLLAAPSPAHASLFQGETLDAVANGISWVVLIIAPIIGIAVFWMLHILPEKIAHKRKHPQTRLIQCLCLMS